MEYLFDHDFSKVRVHTDARAALSARTVGAMAYTIGHDVVIEAGQYSPQTTTGHRLLAHELAHVVQQRDRQEEPTTANLRIGEPAGRLEQEADAAANAAIGGHKVSTTLSSAARSSIQRQSMSQEQILERLQQIEEELTSRSLSPQYEADLQKERDALLEQVQSIGAQSAPPPRGRREERDAPTLETDPEAFRGIDLYFMVRTVPRSDYVDPSKIIRRDPYRLVPQLRRREGKRVTVVYYVAYRDDSERNEYIIGPDSLKEFLTNLEGYVRAANVGYAWLPPGYQPTEYQAAGAEFVREGSVEALGRSWGAAARDPHWWLEALMGTLGAAASLPRAGPPRLRGIPGGVGAGVGPKVVAPAPPVRSPAVTTGAALAPRVTPVASAAPAPGLKLVPQPAGVPVAPIAPVPAPAVAAAVAASAVSAAPGPSVSAPVPAPQGGQKPRNPQDECLAANPHSFPCTDSRSMEEVAVSFIMHAGYAPEDLGECWKMGSFGPQEIEHCDDAPGERYHCSVGQGDVVSLFGCLCCQDDGTTSYEWRPHWSYRASKRQTSGKPPKKRR